MDKAQFEGTDSNGWWMLEGELDSLLVEPRKELGDAFGWFGTEWWTEQTKLEEMYRFLEGMALMRDLDDAQDLDRRRKWISEVIAAKAPAEDAPLPSAEAEAVTEAPAPVATEAAPAAPPEAPAKKSIFAKKAAPESVATEAAPAAPPEAPAKKSIFAKKAAPEPATAPATEAEPDIKQLLAELATDPNIPLESVEVEEMLKDPDFHAKLAAAEADIEAELEALEA